MNYFSKAVSYEEHRGMEKREGNRKGRRGKTKIRSLLRSKSKCRKMNNSKAEEE